MFYFHAPLYGTGLFVGSETFYHQFNDYFAMVRIQKRLVKKRYYGKAEYQYPVYSLNIPKKYHNLLQPFLNQDLQANIEHKTNTLTITLTPRK